MGVKLHPITKTHQSQINAARVPFRILLAGTSNPTVFSSAVKSVSRLSTATPTPFYRIELAEGWALTGKAAVMECHAIPAVDDENVYICNITRGLTADPEGLPENDTRFFDVLVGQVGSNFTNSLDGTTLCGVLSVDQ